MPEEFDIAFGTDGWRGVIARDFTMTNVARVGRALAARLMEDAARPHVIVGYDSRFLSPEFARVAAFALEHEGVDVQLTPQTVPTPALSWAVQHHGADAGVMITASHNPPQWNGVKLKGPYGGTALPEFTREVESHLHRGQRDENAPQLPGLLELLSKDAAATYSTVDPVPGYLEQVRSLISITPDAVLNLASAPNPVGSAKAPVIVVDPMYGAARGLFPRLLEPYGFSVIELHGEYNPGFGGERPEPINAHLQLLREQVVRQGALLGLATDGDGDRIGAVDETGQFVDAQYIFALLLELLAEDKGWRGLVVKTNAVTDLVDRMCEHYGLPIRRTPVGFKYVCELAIETDVLIGGEESGGIGVKNHVPERDGLLCGLLLTELVVRRQKPLGVLVRELQERFGPHVYRRIDLAMAPSLKTRLMDRLAAEPPRSFGRFGVSAVDQLDGFRFSLQGGGWILFRPSGTEPLVRVYAEAPSLDELESLLEHGQRFIDTLD